MDHIVIAKGFVWVILVVLAIDIILKLFVFVIEIEDHEGGENGNEGVVIKNVKHIVNDNCLTSDLTSNILLSICNQSSNPGIDNNTNNTHNNYNNSTIFYNTNRH